MLGSHVELALHDRTVLDHSVIGIANGHVTGRSIGNSVLSGPKDDKSFAAAMAEMNVRGQAIRAPIEDYSTENFSGQRLRSSSVGAHWKGPQKWNRDAAAEGVRRRVSCASMADVFEQRPDLVVPRRRPLGLKRMLRVALAP